LLPWNDSEPDSLLFSSSAHRTPAAYTGEPNRHAQPSTDFIVLLDEGTAKALHKRRHELELLEIGEAGHRIRRRPPNDAAPVAHELERLGNLHHNDVESGGNRIGVGPKLGEQSRLNLGREAIDIRDALHVAETPGDSDYDQVLQY
jgi:hypothetical protein